MKTTFEYKFEIDFFRHIKAERIHHQQTHTIRNAKGSPSDRMKIPDGNKDVHKRLKSTGNGNYVCKYKIMFSHLFKSQQRIIHYLMRK